MSEDYIDLREKGFDVEAALSFTGGPDKYSLALTRFHNAYDKNKTKLQKYLDSGDLDSYSMLVHSLKSNARMIGQNTLGDISEKLQYASADRDMKVIEENHDNMLSLYERTVHMIEPYALSNEGLSRTDAVKLIDNLKDSLDDCDYNESVKLYSELTKYNFKPADKITLNDIKELIDTFSYDEAVDKLEELDL